MTHLTRRKLLGVSLSGATAAVMTGPRTLAAAIQEQVQIAVVGVRGAGRRHLRRLQRRRDVRVAAICDVDQRVLAGAQEGIEKAGGLAPTLVEDYRHLLDDKSIDALIIATPNHWHGPIAINAVQAGKDVYVENPCSHVFREGQVLVQAARRFGRVFQHGTPMRSSEVTARAAEVLDSGILGTVKMTKAWNCRSHWQPASVPDSPPPGHVNYQMWLGPAPERPFNTNRFHDHWRWHRDYGNGPIGAHGVDDLDLARWALGVTTHPERITAHGSRIHLTGRCDFPDNMMVAYHYPEGKVLLYEERSWTPYGPHGFDSGNVFYGTEGLMVFSRRGYFQVYLGVDREAGPGMRGGSGHSQHLHDFLECVRTRQVTVAPPQVAHLSCGLMHLGEIAHRVGHVLEFDAAGEAFRHVEQANQLLKKQYRAPWSIPANT
ncbi:MAG: dehydrogenase [Planctomycetaceae bacterium]|nr:dehydrogenase [Planctomycetaceae bacterium]